MTSTPRISLPAAGACRMLGSKARGGRSSRPRAEEARLCTGTVANMPPALGNLYAILGVGRRCSFEALKKAYYRRAKECHPDLHQDDPGMEEEFKRLVQAFDVLSDPPRRKAYDEQTALDVTVGAITFEREDGPSVMDSVADDILEEMIVGNHVPRDATLQTLMRDLKRTELFVTFREARNLCSGQRYRPALRLLRRLTADSPCNILYHYNLAACADALGMTSLARRHFRLCLQIGDTRTPPQRLRRIRRRLQDLRKREGPVGRFIARLSPQVEDAALPVEQKLRDELNRAMRSLLRDDRKRRQRLRSPPRLLGE